ncbi:hypothetical protein ACFVWY_33835 [Streptomyces sp. NPDC058195]|uniref:hypothetical protein n=1 Tax=Streptomyces sp. NPDC058195 TaxID=3346375 RepID=UPI0036E8AF5F
MSQEQPHHNGDQAAPTAAARFAERMSTILDEYEQERRAEITAAGGHPDDDGSRDVLTRRTLASIAYRYDTQSDSPSRRQPLIDELADTFTLADVRIIRTVAAALADAMPQMALASRDAGKRPDRIAAESGYTASRVAQLIREERQRHASDTQ